MPNIVNHVDGQQKQNYKRPKKLKKLRNLRKKQKLDLEQVKVFGEKPEKCVSNKYLISITKRLRIRIYNKLREDIFILAKCAK